LCFDVFCLFCFIDFYNFVSCAPCTTDFHCICRLKTLFNAGWSWSVSRAKQDLFAQLLVSNFFGSDQVSIAEAPPT
jgi:hypothetical protein